MLRERTRDPRPRASGTDASELEVGGADLSDQGRRDEQGVGRELARGLNDQDEQGVEDQGKETRGSTT